MSVACIRWSYSAVRIVEVEQCCFVSTGQSLLSSTNSKLENALELYHARLDLSARLPVDLSLSARFGHVLLIAYTRSHGTSEVTDSKAGSRNLGHGLKSHEFVRGSPLVQIHLYQGEVLASPNTSFASRMRPTGTV